MHRLLFALVFLLQLLLVQGCGHQAAGAQSSSQAVSPAHDARPEFQSGQLPDGLGRRLNAAVEDEFKRLHLASICLVLFDRQGIVHEVSLGQANREDDVAATLDTPYRWGSNSKLFVMLALLQLVDEGKVSLDDPLLRHVPNFSLQPPSPHHPESATWRLTDITLRSMLTHHSGIPSEYFSAFLSQHPFALAEFPARIAQMHAQSPVWVAHSYSNLAYTLLGLVVQNVAQRPFSEYVRERLFAPLRMQSASFEITAPLATRLARSYDAQGLLLPRYRLSMTPAGGLNASTRDMVQFGRVVLNHGQAEGGPLVTRALFDAALTRQNARVALDFDLKQGLTWFIDRRPVTRVGHTVEHGGTIAGHHSSFILSLDRGYGVLAVTNSEQGSVAVQQLSLLALELVLNRSTRRPGETLAATHTDAYPSTKPTALEQWAGHYTTPLGPAELLARGDRLETEAFGQQLRLKPTSDGSLQVFLHKWAFDLQPSDLAPLRLRLLRVEERDVVVAYTPRGRERIALRYRPHPASETWLLRAGTYVPLYEDGELPFLPGLRLSVDEQNAMQAQVVDPTLSQAHAPRHPLYIVNDEVAVGQGLGRNQATELRFDQAGRLNVMGLWFKRVAQP